MKSIAPIILVIFSLASTELATAEDPTAIPSRAEKSVMTTQALLKSLVGNWQGTVRTWFEPGKLADESTVTGSIRLLPEGNFIRHDYLGSMQGKPRRGEETITVNTVTQQVQVVWFDTFHMNYAFLQSEGPATATGFTVRGKYDAAPNTPQWGWRTEYVLHDADHLSITAYNVTPEGPEAKGVETLYERVKP